MRVGVPKEIKSHENRVGLVPAAVRELGHHGHQLIVETEAGLGIGLIIVRLAPKSRQTLRSFLRPPT
jgi:alanine dehydrogenase